jgi:hypothetical protein
MSPDLTRLLSEWPYEPGKVNCRLVRGADGSEKVQIRLELGILQLEADGRPDGTRPKGFPSMLDALQSEIEGPADGAERAGEAAPPGPENPSSRTLTPEECAGLRDEAEQYYRRYVALSVLEDHERVVRDTTRNLQLLDFCREHAEREQDRTALEELRPMLLMTRTRALASIALRHNEAKAAVAALDEGLESLRRVFAEAGRPQLFEKSSEAQALRAMREGLVPKLPLSQKAELRTRLSQALREENYELAAILRDELKQLPE